MTQRPLRTIGLHNIKHIWKKKRLLLRLIVIESSCQTVIVSELEEESWAVEYAKYCEERERDLFGYEA